MNIQDRIHWYLADGRGWYQRNPNGIKFITVHHDAIPQTGQTADQVLSQVMGIHNTQKGWPGVSYHFYIHTDGTVYQLNKFEDVTWHDSNNWDSIGVMLHGYFHPDYNNKPTDAQLKSLKELLDWLCTQNPQFPADHDDVVGHRDRWSTACPGNELYPYVTDYKAKLGSVDWAKGDNMSNGDEFGQTVKKSTQFDKICEYLNYSQPFHEVQAETIINSIKGWKGRISELEGKLSNFLSLKARAADGDEREVGWYVAEWFNRSEQVGRLKEQLSDKDQTIKTLEDQVKSKADDAQIIENLTETIAKRDEKIEEMSRARGELVHTITELEASIQTLEQHLKETRPEPTIPQLIAQIINKLLGGGVK